MKCNASNKSIVPFEHLTNCRHMNACLEYVGFDKFAQSVLNSKNGVVLRHLYAVLPLDKNEKSKIGQ